MTSNSLRAVRRNGNGAVIWVLVATAIVLVAAIGYLLFASDLFGDEPTSDLERDYQMLLAGLPDNPDNPALLMTLAEVEYELGKTAEALDRAEQAIALSEDQPGMHIRYAALLFRDGDLEAAREQAEAELSIEGATANAEPHFVIAQIAWEQGDYDAAIASMDAGLAIDPIAADMMIVYGRILEDAGRTDDAIAQYREAFRFLPENADLVDTLQRLGVSVEASETPTAPHGDTP